MVPLTASGLLRLPRSFHPERYPTTTDAQSTFSFLATIRTQQQSTLTREATAPARYYKATKYIIRYRAERIRWPSRATRRLGSGGGGMRAGQGLPVCPRVVTPSGSRSSAPPEIGSRTPRSRSPAAEPSRPAHEPATKTNGAETRARGTGVSVSCTRRYRLIYFEILASVPYLSPSLFRSRNAQTKLRRRGNAPVGEGGAGL